MIRYFIEYKQRNGRIKSCDRQIFVDFTIWKLDKRYLAWPNAKKLIKIGPVFEERFFISQAEDTDSSIFVSHMFTQYLHSLLLTVKFIDLHKITRKNKISDYLEAQNFVFVPSLYGGILCILNLAVEEVWSRGTYIVSSWLILTDIWKHIWSEYVTIDTNIFRSIHVTSPLEEKRLWNFWCFIFWLNDSEMNFCEIVTRIKQLREWLESTDKFPTYWFWSRKLS